MKLIDFLALTTVAYETPKGVANLESDGDSYILRYDNGTIHSGLSRADINLIDDQITTEEQAVFK